MPEREKLMIEDCRMKNKKRRRFRFSIAIPYICNLQCEPSEGGAIAQETSGSLRASP